MTRRVNGNKSIPVSKIQKRATPCSQPSSNLLFLVSQRSESSPLRKAVATSEFLGPTSYSAVFKENQASFGYDLLNADHEDDADRPRLDLRGSSTEHDEWKRSECIDLGTRILKNFPDLTLCERLLDRHFEGVDLALHEPTIRYFHESIWSTFGNFLTESRDPELLAAMTNKIFEGQSMPLPPTKSTREWLESITSHRFRWEIVGILCAVFGLSAMSLPDWDPSFAHYTDGDTKDRSQFARKMSECAEACLVLCEDSGIMNEFVIWLMHHLQVLQSSHSGDTCKSRYQLRHLAPFIISSWISHYTHLRDS